MANGKPTPQAKSPSGLIPTKDEFAAAGYDVAGYDAFVAGRKKEIAAIVAEMAPAQPLTPTDAIARSGLSVQQLQTIVGAESEAELLRWVASMLTSSDVKVEPKYKRIRLFYQQPALGFEGRRIPIPKKLVETRHRRAVTVQDEEGDTRVIAAEQHWIAPGQVLEIDADQWLLHWLRRHRQMRVELLENGTHSEFKDGKVVMSEFLPPVADPKLGDQQPPTTAKPQPAAPGITPAPDDDEDDDAPTTASVAPAAATQKVEQAAVPAPK